MGLLSELSPEDQNSQEAYSPLECREATAPVWGQGVLLPKGETLRNLEGPRRGVFSLSQNGDSREQSGKPKVPNYNEGGKVFCHWRPLGLA